MCINNDIKCTVVDVVHVSNKLFLFWAHLIFFFYFPPGKQRPACLDGWEMAVKCLLQLWDTLQTEHNFQCLLTNRLNQDCLCREFVLSYSMQQRRAWLWAIPICSRTGIILLMLLFKFINWRHIHAHSCICLYMYCAVRDITWL